MSWPEPIAFGGLELGDLPPGGLRELTAGELRGAFGAAVPVGRGPVGARHGRC